MLGTNRVPSLTKSRKNPVAMSIPSFLSLLCLDQQKFASPCLIGYFEADDGESLKLMMAKEGQQTVVLGVTGESLATKRLSWSGS